MEIKLRKGQYVSFDDDKKVKIVGKILRIKKGIAFLECMTSIQDNIHTHLRKNIINHIYVHCDNLQKESCIKIYVSNETLMYKIAKTYSEIISINSITSKYLIEKISNGAKLLLVYNNNESHICYIRDYVLRNHILTLQITPVELQKI